MIIPKANNERDNFPCWKAIVDSDGNRRKPIIYCQCGKPCGIESHSVSEEGKVTPSFHHLKKQNHELQQGEINGCGFHEYLELEDFQSQEK